MKTATPTPTKTKKIRILVVDDENVVREGFVAILRLQDDMQVVGEALNGLDAVKMAQKTKPDGGTQVVITVPKDPSVKPIKHRQEI